VSDRTITFTIPIVTPSQNEWDQWHWGKKKKWKEQCYLLLKNQIQLVQHSHFLPKDCNNTKEDGIKVSFTIVRFGHHKLDHGNLVGGCKGLVDTMVSLNLLADDSPKWVDEHYSQSVDRKNKRTEITLLWDQAEGAVSKKNSQDNVIQLPTESVMLKADNWPVEVSKIEIKESYNDDKGNPYIKVRVALVVEDMKVCEVPMVGSAVSEILKQSEAVEEGSNSYSISIKRDFGLCAYTFKAGKLRSSIKGGPVNRPTVTIVDQTVSLRWTVEDLQFTPRQLESLCQMVKAEGVTMSAQSLNKEIPFPTDDQQSLPISN
jgi:hypothetical protein